MKNYDEKKEIINNNVDAVAEEVAVYGAPVNRRGGYRTFTIHAPESMEFVYSATPDPEVEFERNALALYPYIMMGQISNGRAAEILGVNKWNLIEWYESQGLMCLVTTIDDVKHDLETMRRLGMLRA